MERKRKRKQKHFFLWPSLPLICNCWKTFPAFIGGSKLTYIINYTVSLRVTGDIPTLFFDPELSSSWSGEKENPFSYPFNPTPAQP